MTPVYFLATKLQAFARRGGGDFLASRDIEDIVSVVDGRPGIVRDVSEAPDDVVRFVAGSFAAHLEEPRFRESVQGHLPPDRVSQARAVIVLERLAAIAARTD